MSQALLDRGTFFLTFSGCFCLFFCCPRQQRPTVCFLSSLFQYLLIVDGALEAIENKEVTFLLIRFSISEGKKKMNGERGNVTSEITTAPISSVAIFKTSTSCD